MARTTAEFREFRSMLIEQTVNTGRAGYGKNDNELSLYVVGTSFRQHVLRTMHDESASIRDLTLIRDPVSRYSPHAISVQSKYGAIGFIPNEVAEILAPQLDAGRLQIEVIYGAMDDYCRDDGEDFLGVRIEIRLYPWTDDVVDSCD